MDTHDNKHVAKSVRQSLQPAQDLPDFPVSSSLDIMRRKQSLSQMSPSDILSMQSVIGNQNVQRLIQRETFDEDVNIAGNLVVGGQSIIGADATIGGSADVGGDMEVAGNSSSGGNSDIGGDADIAGNNDVGGSVDVGGNNEVAGNSMIAGSTDIGASTTVGGNLDVGGAISSPSLDEQRI